MTDAVLRKLESFRPVSDEDKARLSEILSTDARPIAARTDIIVEGDNPEHVHLILSGLACRYKMLKDGKRQIVAYLLPGDFCDMHTYIMKATDHSIATIAASTVVEIPRTHVDEIMSLPSLSTSMLMSTLVDEATLREWITNVGQRPADRRIGHLFCELYARMKLVGLAVDGRFELPLTQQDLADTVGLSLVHVNRSLRALREQQLVAFIEKKIVISDVARLEKYCGFSSNYLHLDEGRRREQAVGAA